MIGYHKLRARRAGSRRYIDLHVQFARGTTLERAHQLSHELQRAIGAEVGGADVLIHLEPEDALEPRARARSTRRACPERLLRAAQRRLIAADAATASSTAK